MKYLLSKYLKECALCVCLHRVAHHALHPSSSSGQTGCPLCLPVVGTLHTRKSDNFLNGSDTGRGSHPQPWARVERSENSSQSSPHFHTRSVHKKGKHTHSSTNTKRQCIRSVAPVGCRNWSTSKVPGAEVRLINCSSTARRQSQNAPTTLSTTRFECVCVCGCVRVILWCVQSFRQRGPARTLAALELDWTWWSIWSGIKIVFKIVCFYRPETDTVWKVREIGLKDGEASEREKSNPIRTNNICQPTVCRSKVRHKALCGMCWHHHWFI